MKVTLCRSCQQPTEFHYLVYCTACLPKAARQKEAEEDRRPATRGQVTYPKGPGICEKHRKYSCVLCFGISRTL